MKRTVAKMVDTLYSSSVIQDCIRALFNSHYPVADLSLSSFKLPTFGFCNSMDRAIKVVTFDELTTPSSVVDTSLCFALIKGQDFFKKDLGACLSAVSRSEKDLELVHP